MHKKTDAGDEAANPFILGTKETCELFDISRETLSAWAKRGAPKDGRGMWDIKKLIKWRYGETTESPEARKTRADANFREIKVKKEELALGLLEGRLIERKEVDQQWASVGVMIKNNLLTWSKSLTPHLAHQDMRSVESTLKEAVYDLLEQLSGTGRYKASKKKA